MNKIVDAGSSALGIPGEEKAVENVNLGYDGPMGPLIYAIGEHSEIYIEQVYARVEALTGGVVEAGTKYAVSAPGVEGDPTDGPLLLIASERSERLKRMCCAPQNGQFIDLFHAEPGWTAHNIHGYLGRPECMIPTKPNELMTNPPILSMERPGCCQGNNCLICPSVTDMCTDRMTLHQGYVPGDPGSVENGGAPLLYMKQTPGLGGAMRAPEVKVMSAADPTGDQGVPLTLTGPMFFGGCSEFCMDSPFVANASDGSIVGVIRKVRPGNFFAFHNLNLTQLHRSECCVCTDSDRYKITFNPGAQPEDKAAMLSTALLAHLMFFEYDTSCCRLKNERWPRWLACNLINCYFMGCLCPCSLKKSPYVAQSRHSVNVSFLVRRRH